MIYNIRHCFLDDSLVQTIDTERDDVKRTDHQLSALVEIAGRDDFAYFITTGVDEGAVVIYPQYKSSYSVMWYTKDGTCHSAILHPVLPHRFATHGKHRPVDINSPVYASRRKAS